MVCWFADLLVCQLVGLLKIFAGAPGEKRWDGQFQEIFRTLFDDQRIDRDKITGGEAPFRESEVDAVHPEGELVFELRQVRVFERGAVADDETALTSVCVLQRGEAGDAHAAEGVEGRRGPFGRALQGVAGVAREVEERLRGKLF